MTLKNEYAYKNLTSQIYYGSTPDFNWGGIKIVFLCNVPRRASYEYWQIAKNVLRQFADEYPDLMEWSTQTQIQLASNDEVDPLNLAWKTLQFAQQMHDYPVKLTHVKQQENKYEIVFFASCPYAEYVIRCLSLCVIWLNISNEILKKKIISIKSEWIEVFSNKYKSLSNYVPSALVRGLHYDLWSGGVNWSWVRDENTQVGMGVHQRIFQGYPADVNIRNEIPNWRVPIYTITGSVGKTTTTRLLWQLLQNTGKTLALAVSDGAWIGTRKVSDGDCIGGRSALALLKSPVVEGAIFEQGRGGLIKQGVPYAQSDIAILLNVQSVHLGLDGIDTLEKMADTKLAGLRPARIWVLNRDDAQCRRISAQHAAKDTVWFSVIANLGDVQILSKKSLGVLCVARDGDGEPVALCIFQDGHEIKRLDLSGVAPYHGMLGEKTLEELLAAVAAAWFGPLHVSDWSTRLSTLRLDNSNHTFRTSIHRQGQVIFVLDKAAERASLSSLKQVMQELAAREGCQHSIAVLTRSAGETPERHKESAQVLHSFMDEFVCFDRPETYTTSHALPVYSPGSIPTLLKTYFDECNNELGVNKPVVLAEDWAAAQKYLFEKLSKVTGKTLVLINQPGTGLTELNQQILAFASTGLDFQKNLNDTI